TSPPPRLLSFSLSPPPPPPPPPPSPYTPLFRSHRLRRPGRSSPRVARRTSRSGSRDPACHAGSHNARQLADALNPFAGGRPRVVRAPRLAGRAGRLSSEHFSQALEQAGIRLGAARRRPGQDVEQPLDVAPQPPERHSGLVIRGRFDSLAVQQPRPQIREIDAGPDGQLERAPEPPVDLDEAGRA